MKFFIKEPYFKKFELYEFELLFTIIIKVYNVLLLQGILNKMQLILKNKAPGLVFFYFQIL